MKNCNCANEIHDDSKEHRINCMKDTVQEMALNPEEKNTGVTTIQVNKYGRNSSQSCTLKEIVKYNKTTKYKNRKVERVHPIQRKTNENKSTLLVHILT